MKRTYMVPALQVDEAQVQHMMAISVEDDKADPEMGVLTKKNEAWEYWDDEAE